MLLFLCFMISTHKSQTSTVSIDKRTHVVSFNNFKGSSYHKIGSLQLLSNDKLLLKLRPLGKSLSNTKIKDKKKGKILLCGGLSIPTLCFLFIIYTQSLVQRLWLDKNKYLNLLSSDTQEIVKQPVTPQASRVKTYRV